MNDVTGKELAVGDKVVFIPQGGYTSSLSRGTIIGFTPQKVRIESPKEHMNDEDTCLKFPNQVAKV